MMPDDFPRQTRNHSLGELAADDLPDLSAMPDPRGSPQGESLPPLQQPFTMPGPNSVREMLQPSDLPDMNSPEQHAQDFQRFYSSLPFGMRLGIAEQGGLPTMASQFMQQRQQAAQQQQALQEKKNQQHLQMIEKLMAGGHHEALLEYGKQNPDSPASLIGQSLSKQSLADVIAGANEGMIPQDVLQRIVTKQATPTEIKSWGDVVVEARKANSKEKAKAHMLKTALDTPKEKRSPYQQQLADEHETALQLKQKDIELKDSQIYKNYQAADKPPAPDTTTIGRLHETISGGLPWAQGTDATRRKTMDEYARLYPEGRTNVMLGTPAKAEERSNLVDRKAFMEKDMIKQPPPGTTAGGTRSGDYVEMTDKQREDWSGIVNSGATLKTLFDMVDPLITATTPTQALKQYGKLSLGAVAKTNPAAATYLADSEAFSSRMARVFGSEVGVLTQGDVNRWKNALPSFGDTKDVLAKKREVFFSIYKQTREMYKKKIAGEDWTEDYVKLSRGPLADAQKLGIHSKTTDEQFDILMGK